MKILKINVLFMTIFFAENSHCTDSSSISNSVSSTSLSSLCDPDNSSSSFPTSHNNFEEDDSHNKRNVVRMDLKIEKGEGRPRGPSYNRVSFDYNPVNPPLEETSPHSRGPMKRSTSFGKPTESFEVSDDVIENFLRIYREFSGKNSRE